MHVRTDVRLGYTVLYSVLLHVVGKLEDCQRKKRDKQYSSKGLIFLESCNLRHLCTSAGTLLGIFHLGKPSFSIVEFPTGEMTI